MQAKKPALLNSAPDRTSGFQALFNPESIAFLGASKDPMKWGFRILSNLVEGGYEGRIYPVNPKGGEVLGLKIYSQVADIPETPELAFVVVPPPSVPAALKECIDRGSKAGVIITAGFAETSGEGARLQQEIVQMAHTSGMVLVGPNGQGIISTSSKLYCWMVPLFPRPGRIAIISQSGAVQATLVRQLIIFGFGVSKCVSSGNEADLHSEDYLHYLSNDEQTKVILSYIEGLKDGPRFFQIAKEASKKKPVIIIKSGETSAGAQAAMSHTASLAGTDVVFEAMCKQAGIIRVRALDELFNTCSGFLCHPLPKGRRVGIISAGGGWGVLAADACAKLGLEVVTLPPETIKELDSLMPAWWNRGNPIDLVAGLFGDAILKVMDIVLRCPIVDGLIFIGIHPALHPQSPSASMTPEERQKAREAEPEITAGVFDRVNDMVLKYGKPIIAASDPNTIDSGLIQKINLALAKQNQVCYRFPHQAAAVFAKLVEYSEHLQ